MRINPFQSHVASEDSWTRAMSELDKDVGEVGEEGLALLLRQGGPNERQMLSWDGFRDHEAVAHLIRQEQGLRDGNIMVSREVSFKLALAR